MLIDLRVKDGFGEFRNQYLYSYLYRFIEKSELSVNQDGAVVISPEKKYILISYIEEALEALLGDLYKDPSPKEFQRKRTQFEKINFKDVVYKVNWSHPGWV